MSSYTDTVQRLHIAFFYAPAAPALLARLSAALADGSATPGTIAAEFGQTPEFAQRIANSSPSMTVDMLYYSQFGRPMPTAERNYHVSLLENKDISAAGLLLYYMQSATGADLQLQQLRAGLAQAYTEALSKTGGIPDLIASQAAVNVRSWLSAAHDDASAQKALAGLDALIASVTLQLHDGTPNNDIVMGTQGSDTIAGGDGIDYIYASGGSDTLAGGALSGQGTSTSYDTLDYSLQAGPIVYRADLAPQARGEATVTYANGADRVSGFGTIVGTRGDDVFHVGPSAVGVRGGEGSDTVYIDADLRQVAMMMGLPTAANTISFNYYREVDGKPTMLNFGASDVETFVFRGGLTLTLAELKAIAAVVPQSYDRTALPELMLKAGLKPDSFASLGAMTVGTADGDTMSFGAAAGSFLGGAGDDRFVATANGEAHILYGGAGRDVADYTANASGIVYRPSYAANDWSNVYASVQVGGQTDLLSSIEVIRGGGGGDTFYLPAGYDFSEASPKTFDGGAGYDRVISPFEVELLAVRRDEAGQLVLVQDYSLQRTLVGIEEIDMADGMRFLTADLQKLLAQTAAPTPVVDGSLSLAKAAFYITPKDIYSRGGIDYSPLAEARIFDIAAYGFVRVYKAASENSHGADFGYVDRITGTAGNDVFNGVVRSIERLDGGSGKDEAHFAGSAEYGFVSKSAAGNLAINGTELVNMETIFLPAKAGAAAETAYSVSAVLAKLAQWQGAGMPSLTALMNDAPTATSRMSTAALADGRLRLDFSQDGSALTFTETNRDGMPRDAQYIVSEKAGARLPVLFGDIGEIVGTDQNDTFLDSRGLLKLDGGGGIDQLVSDFAASVFRIGRSSSGALVINETEVQNVEYYSVRTQNAAESLLTYSTADMLDMVSRSQKTGYVTLADLLKEFPAVHAVTIPGLLTSVSTTLVGVVSDAPSYVI